MKQYFYYDQKDCEFRPIQYPIKDRIIHTACSTMLYGMVLSVIAVVCMSFVAGTPSEIALKAENRELYQQLNNTREVISDIDARISELAQLDNELYRSMLGMDPIPYDERQAGAGGADIYADFDVYQAETADLLKWAANSMENIERRINIQMLSFEELKSYYNENQEKLRQLPVIRPVQGVILSGYGMRVHPVHRIRRMHDGVDFRASIGTPVYATGDGVVKMARRRGTYGNLLEIDHGFGYETRYAHLSRFAEGIAPGAKVKRGQLIAYSGNTGITSGPHLHYEIRHNGNSVDPLGFLFGDITPEEYREFRRIAEENPMSMD